MKQITEEKRQFIKDIQVWGSQWVSDVKQCILNHLDELYEDEAIRHIARKYAEEVETYNRMNENWLLRSYEYDCNEIVTYTNSFTQSYSQVLYELCYRRYTR